MESAEMQRRQATVLRAPLVKLLSGMTVMMFQIMSHPKRTQHDVS
jgi:hypothetical protein